MNVSVSQFIEFLFWEVKFGSFFCQIWLIFFVKIENSLKRKLSCQNRTLKVNFL